MATDTNTFLLLQTLHGAIISSHVSDYLIVSFGDSMRMLIFFKTSGEASSLIKCCIARNAFSLEAVSEEEESLTDFFTTSRMHTMLFA